MTKNSGNRKRNQQDSASSSDTPGSGGVAVSADDRQQSGDPQLLRPVRLLDGETVLIQTEFVGPLPPPDFMRKYNEVCPGLADKIADSFFIESEHRREMERKNHELDKHFLGETIKSDVRGSWMAFALGLTALAAATYTSVNGAQWAGGAIGCAGLGAIIYAYKSGIKINHFSSQKEDDPESSKSETEKPAKK